jgi:FlaA1/EpsC-like NDP-sugar epimerase
MVQNRVAQIIVDGAIAMASLLVGYLLRFDGFPAHPYDSQFGMLMFWMLVVRLCLLAAFGFYRCGDRPHPCSAYGLSKMANAIAFGSAVSLVVHLALRSFATDVVVVPIGVFAMEALFSFAGLTGVRAVFFRSTSRATEAKPDAAFSEQHIGDLLGRPPVQSERKNVSLFLDGKTVMVTGAGGSIGSELCRQICCFAPRRLVLVDLDENQIFQLPMELAYISRHLEVRPIVGNVTNVERMRRLMDDLRPDVVFHAAARKHVPLMEQNPHEAISNNVLGTRIMADLADDFEAEAFVLISTDKAVNPSSVMGASKRLAEMYVQSLAERSKTRYLTVRFGNVFGSRGSVVPLFNEQIARGGPVTITHPDMRRYFMTIGEAVELVLQAATIGHGGEIFTLEMGKPLRIVDLAHNLIRMSGNRPNIDIAIVYVGIRPGEKLCEEMSLDREKVCKTQHPRIWVGQYQQLDHRKASKLVQELAALVEHVDKDSLIARLAQIVPEYHPRSHRDTLISQTNRLLPKGVEPAS